MSKKTKKSKSRFGKFFWISIAITVFGLVAAVIISQQKQEVRSHASGSELLTWSPPAGYQNYTKYTLSSPGTYTLNDNTDYIISAPSRIDGAVILKGGRNVVWIGGHIYIPMQTDLTTSKRRALVVQDTASTIDGRIVHIEGILMNGPDITEGINTDSKERRTILQVQNVRVENLHFRNAADRDSGNHPDLIQTWGNIKELRVDKFTGESSYQGFFLRSAYTYPHGNVYIRRTNLSSITSIGDDGISYSAKRLFFWMYAEEEQAEGRGLLQSAPHTFIDNGTFWIKHGDFDESVHPGMRNYGSNSNYKPVKLADSVGTYLYWTSKATLLDGIPAVRNFDNTKDGIIYSGTPPAGDYVPVNTVGLTYLSPGYGFTSTDSITLTPTSVLSTPTPTSVSPTPTPTLVSTDITSPSVSIVSPSNGATVARGKAQVITANASDNVGVTKVEFYVNNSLKCTDTTAFYSCSWSAPSKPNKTYTLKAVAYDGANNSSQSTVAVTAK